MINNITQPRHLMASVSLLVPSLALCAFIGLQAGCASEPESHLVSAPPPSAPSTTMMTTTTTTTPAAMVVAPTYVATVPAAPVMTTVVVTQAPPAMQADVVIAQPSTKHVWIAGHYTWRDNQYQWMTAHWELPPYANATWVNPTSEQQGNAYKFTEGYWN